MFPEVEVSGLGKFRITGQPIKLSETPAQIYHNPPALGEDNEAVYTQLGYTPEEIREMTESGII